MTLDESFAFSVIAPQLFCAFMDITKTVHACKRKANESLKVQ